MSLASLGAIAGGLNRGIDMAQRDQMLANQQRLQEEQTEAWRQDREFQSGQRGRQISEQARADALRDGLAGVQSDITAEQHGPLMEGQESLPKIVTGQKSQAKIAGEQADIYKKQGFHEQADKLYRWKDEQEAKAAAQAALAASGSYSGTDAYDYLTRVKDAVSADQSPVSVDGVERLDGGRVRVNLKNRITGYSMPMEFSSIQEARDAVTAHYSPDTYNKILERRQAKQDKLDEINAKPLELQPGGQAYDRSGKLLAANSNEPAAVQAARIRAAGGSGSSSTSGKSSDPMKAYTDAFELAATKGEIKLQPNQIADGNRIVTQLAQGGYDAGTAVKIALDVSMDPSKTRLELNPNTGEIDRVYRNPDVSRGRAIVVAPGAGSAKDFEKQAGGPKEAAAAVSGMVSNMLSAVPAERRQSAQTQLVAVATDPAMRKQYLEAAQDAGKDVQAINRQLDLIAAYSAPKQESGPASQVSSILDKLKGVGGMQRPQQSGQPSYEALMKAKQDKEKLMSDVSRMSPDRRESYLAPRLQEIEDRIKFNQNYRTY